VQRELKKNLSTVPMPPRAGEFHVQGLLRDVSGSNYWYGHVLAHLISGDGFFARFARGNAKRRLEAFTAWVDGDAWSTLADYRGRLPA
jgi:hypothetical protein